MADAITAEMEQMVKFDDVFLSILQNCGRIEPFLEAIFYFLARRTDFFRLMHEKDDKLGFPRGVAKKTVLRIFDKYQQIVLQNDPVANREKKSQPSQVPMQSVVSIPPTLPSSTSHDNVPKVIAEEVEVKTEQMVRLAKNSNTNQDRSSCSPESFSKNKTPANNMQSDTSSANDCFNGGQTDRYKWSQSISDVDILIPIPSFIKKSKELSIEIKSLSLNVRLKNDPPEVFFNSNCATKDMTLLEGTLTHRIICEESLWSLVPGEHISINLEKAQQKWWTNVLEGDEEIPRDSIDTTQHVHEFDTQTQADIRKVMHDQQQKMMGKPTSDEQKTHELLKEAWDAEGSPFKGTPFDPSQVNISSGGAF